MVTVASSVVLAVSGHRRRRQRAVAQLDHSSSSSTASVSAVAKVFSVSPLPKVVLRHARVVGGGGPALVGLRYGYRRSISGSSERVPFTVTVPPCVGGLSELHRQRRGLVVVGDGNHRLSGLSRGCGDAAGREPKESSTFSPSSSTESSVAANVMVFSVSAAPKVRESGTPV